MKVFKTLVISALSMAAGALIYKTVTEHQEEIDSFVNEYGEFIEDETMDDDLLEEEY